MRTTLKKTILLLVSIAAFQSGLRAAEDAHEDEIALVKLRPEVRASINNALRYIAAQQKESDGSFGHGTHSTSLALMAFMLQGHIPGQGEYGEALEKGISFLISKGEEQEGYLGSGTHHGSMYEHGLGLLALSEAWGQSKNEKIRPVLRGAVDVLLRCQNEKGGWRYSPKIMPGDISVTAMQVVGLCSAREAGIAVPQKSIDKAAEYMLWCQDEESGGFGYHGPGGPGFARSAAASLALMLSGKREHHSVRRGMAYLKSQDDSVFDPDAKGVSGSYHYAHYYAIQAMYQTSEEELKAWYPKITKRMLASQDPNGSWSAGPGNVYGTAMSILVLGVPYRYLPIYQR
jgi:hypothetical protein